MGGHPQTTLGLDPGPDCPSGPGCQGESERQSQGMPGTTRLMHSTNLALVSIISDLETRPRHTNVIWALGTGKHVRRTCTQLQGLGSH